MRDYRSHLIAAPLSAEVKSSAEKGADRAA
jgi:hypothetical protein